MLWLYTRLENHCLWVHFKQCWSSSTVWQWITAIFLAQVSFYVRSQPAASVAAAAAVGNIYRAVRPARGAPLLAGAELIATHRWRFDLSASVIRDDRVSTPSASGRPRPSRTDCICGRVRCDARRSTVPGRDRRIADHIRVHCLRRVWSMPREICRISLRPHVAVLGRRQVHFVWDMYVTP